MYSKLPLVEQKDSGHDSSVAGSDEQLHHGEDTNSLSPMKDDASHSKRPDQHDNRTTASFRDRFSFSLLYMLATLIAGVSIAVGHHLFYSRLNGQPVDTQLSQTWVNRIGTALAFVVKLFFVAAVGIAYTQYQWRTISRKPWKIRQIDSLTGVVNNAWFFYDISLWTRVPVLTVIAAVSWTIPLAAVVTPGTLTVSPVGRVNTIESQVARYQFNSSQYAWVLQPGEAIGGPGQVIGGWKFVNDFWKASHETSRLATASQLTGQVLQIPTSYNNASYQVRFEAPALKCELASDSLTDIVNETLSQLIPVQFMSWVPSDDHNITTGDSTTILNNYNLYGSIDQNSTDHARLYVLSSSSVSTWRLFECGLHNATYEAAFEFKDSKQKTTILSIKYLNGVSVLGNYSDAPSGPDGLSPLSIQYSYCAAMQAYSSLLVGEHWYDSLASSTIGSLAESNYAMITSVNWTALDTLPQQLESLFHNTTLSMLSSPLLTQDDSLSTKNQVPVTITTYTNTYIYAPKDLLLAYGLSFLAALLSVLIGTYALHSNSGRSYSNLFSTFLRTTRDPGLSALVGSEDFGADPLPRHVGEARVIVEGAKG